ncbi:MAG: phosphoglucosamine mutase [Candidatus Micrarchaeia archaeon]
MLTFGTNGIRGKLDELTPEFAASISCAFGEFAHGRIIVGMDTRTSSEMLKNAVVSGLLSAGCDVVDVGVVPSPTIEFLVLRMRADGGIIVTASHNPPEWNALKFVDRNGVDISRERGAEIEKILRRGLRRAKWNEIRNVERYGSAMQDHAEAIEKNVDADKIRSKKLRIALDCGNGTTSLIAPMLMRRLGMEIVTLNCQPDGFFPGRNSEPTEANIKDLVEFVRSSEFDFGVAWDGDGDRVVFVDEKGRYVIGDKVFALCVGHKLGKDRGKVVTTVATSNVVKSVCEEFGCELVYTRVGAPYLAEKMLEIGAVIGGEEVGGVIWPEISLGKDGLMTAAKIAEMACDKPLSELVEGLPKYYNFKTKVECSHAQKEHVMKALAERFQGENVITIDGVRINFGEEWVIIRPSGTENYIRVFAEARTAGKAEKICREYEKIVREEVCG